MGHLKGTLLHGYDCNAGSLLLLYAWLYGQEDTWSINWQILWLVENNSTIYMCMKVSLCSIQYVFLAITKQFVIFFQSTRQFLHLVLEPFEINPLHLVEKLQMGDPQSHTLHLACYHHCIVLLLNAWLYGQEDDGSLINQ